MWAKNNILPMDIHQARIKLCIWAIACGFDVSIHTNYHSSRMLLMGILKKRLNPLHNNKPWSGNKGHGNPTLDLRRGTTRVYWWSLEGPRGEMKVYSILSTERVKAWYFIQKKVDKKISSLKKNSFSRKHKKVFQFCLNFILKPWSFPLGLYYVEYKIWETLE
jgi:hypothetical protein